MFKKTAMSLLCLVSFVCAMQNIPEDDKQITVTWKGVTESYMIPSKTSVQAFKLFFAKKHEHENIWSEALHLHAWGHKYITRRDRSVVLCTRYISRPLSDEANLFKVMAKHNTTEFKLILNEDVLAGIVDALTISNKINNNTFQ